jgi:signal peptidase I
MDQPPPSAAPDETPAVSPDDVSETESYRRGRKAAPGLVAGAALVAAAGVAFMRYRPARVTIEGVSMAPTLLPGDWVLVVSPGEFDRDDVVVVEHPARPGYEIVKRLVACPGGRVGDRELGADEYWVEGDYAQSSTDSRQFGPVSRTQLKAKALMIYWPVERRGLVR